MRIANLKIGTRLAGGFGIQIILLGIAIVIGITQLSAMNDIVRVLTERNNAITAAAATMRSAQLRVSLLASNVVMLENADEIAEQDKQLLAARDDYNTASKTVHELVSSSEGKAILARIDAGTTETRPLTDIVRTLGKENKNEEAIQVLVKQVGPATARWQAALGELVAYESGVNKRATQTAAAAYSTALTALIVIGVAATLASTLIGWLATRSITVPVNRALKIAQTVASGDLSSQIEVHSSDETGELIGALKTMNASLLDIVGQVRGRTETIASASTQIASGNMDLSSRTEQQAGSLEETAASMEELNATVKQNADNARQANVLAVTASEVALKGGNVVTQVVDTMSSIDASSRKIVDIISVIDGIAFQTNILALNAAVEAARAGEQGRGFAVVASEVRNLAQRSASAAKEIKSLIDDSVSKVALGTSLVGQAGATMEEIVSSITRVTDIMSEISAAGHEQELGIGQVNQAVVEMDAVTQQNAALVEEAAAAAESLKDEARHLTELVSVFKLGNEQLAPRQAPARAKAAPAPLPVRQASKPVAPKRLASAPVKTAKAAAPVEDDSWETF